MKLHHALQDALTDAGIFGASIRPALVMRGLSVEVPARVNTTYAITGYQRSWVDIMPSVFITRRSQIPGCVAWLQREFGMANKQVGDFCAEVYNS